ncbi:membrane alanyl aminopeptidase-like [Aphidius gifuensis]|uniref:membrane alanyl aminopeptidase-like n=1 Tax=Aphidius gifuensis TaxID=684658 RepID=UPI001CDBA899|nr:membrane alanyl aminopeptidase-like [Aphidius gifuensis]
MDIDIEKQFYTITLLNIIQAGKYLLDLFFIGEIRDDVFGFYRSSSKVGNETRWIGVTQFSSTFARRAFPCFDEPYMKAHFKLHIGHYSNQKVTSNTKAESIKKTDEDYCITTMETTPLMSTYLVGWVIHDFTQDNLINSSFRIWARRSMTGRGIQSLMEGRQTYLALESWMKIKNPIEKFDHIAIPDFNFQAMENWGSITMRESVFLHEINQTPTLKIHSGRNTMAHEYAHTWFGNLVTPEFWNVAWLKEGFATFFSYFIHSTRVNKINDNRMMDLFVIEVQQDALLDDSVKHKRTMNGVGIDEVESAFECLDFVTYKKGASVIRMIEQLMNANNFQLALRSYLKNKSFSFATPAVLYHHLNNFTNTHVLDDINIGQVIETYATQPGFPMVTVTRNYLTNSIEITQQRFYQNANLTIDKFNNSKWWIPLNFATNSTNNMNMSNFGSLWLKPSDKVINTSINVNSSEWIICDIDKAGYYRVNYDNHNWDILINYMMFNKFKTLHQVTRATLIDDSFNLARAGYLNYKIPLNLSNYLVRETEYEPWYSAINSFNFLHKMFRGSSTIRTNLENHVKRLTEVIYQFLTFNGTRDEQLRTKLLRNLILSTSCLMNNTDCLKNAKLTFENWMNNKFINPDVKSFVYCVGIRHGNESDWENVFSRLNNTELHSEKELLINGLGCTKNETKINKLLNYSIYAGYEIPKQYQINIFNAALTGNPENVKIVLNYFSKNINNIIQLRRHTFLQKMINSIKKEITSMENLQILKNLIDSNKNNLGKSLKTADNAIKFAEETISWIKRYSPVFAELLITKL